MFPIRVKFRCPDKGDKKRKIFIIKTFKKLNLKKLLLFFAKRSQSLISYYLSDLSEY